MSLRGTTPPLPAARRDVFYTPRHATLSLLEHADMIGLLPRACEVWECAAGAGHMARVLADTGYRVLATDIAPAARQLYPVTLLDFLQSNGLGTRRHHIITNPPYGLQSRLILAFLNHAMALLDRTGGALALLLPFEFDAAPSRNELVGAHPYFVGKATVARRIRWANLAQRGPGPMGHHAWYLWSTSRAVQLRARSLPMMVSR